MKGEVCMSFVYGVDRHVTRPARGAPPVQPRGGRTKSGTASVRCQRRCRNHADLRRPNGIGRMELAIECRKRQGEAVEDEGHRRRLAG